MTARPTTQREAIERAELALEKCVETLYSGYVYNLCREALEALRGVGEDDCEGCDPSAIRNSALEEAAKFLETHTVISVNGIRQVDKTDGRSKTRNENIHADAIRALKQTPAVRSEAGNVLPDNWFVESVKATTINRGEKAKWYHATIRKVTEYDNNERRFGEGKSHEAAVLAAIARIPGGQS